MRCNVCFNIDQGDYKVGDIASSLGANKVNKDLDSLFAKSKKSPVFAAAPTPKEEEPEEAPEEEEEKTK